MRVTFAALMSLVLSPSWSFAEDRFQGWQDAEIVGEITERSLPEASGIAFSKADPRRLYHINDAGSSPSLIVTGLTGENPRTITLDVPSVTDTEDLAMGPCPDQGPCVYIGDIGDNKSKRPFVTLHVIRDTVSLPQTVSPVFTARLTYDDGKSHNAESLAIHRDGSAYILTKEIPALLFRFAIADLREGDEIALEKVGAIDLSEWLSGTDKPNKILPTSMDIRPDGRQIVILTRAAGISLDLDLSQALKDAPFSLNTLIAEQDIPVARLPMIQLPQSEAVTYIDGGSAILYSSEIVETGDSSAPLVRIESASSQPARSLRWNAGRHFSAF